MSHRPAEPRSIELHRVVGSRIATLPEDRRTRCAELLTLAEART